MMWLSRSDSLLTIPTRCFSSSSSGTRQPKILTDLPQLSSANVGKPPAKNIFPRTIKKDDPALQIRGYQPASHGMDDVLSEILEIEKLFSLFFKLHSLATK